MQPAYAANRAPNIGYIAHFLGMSASQQVVLHGEHGGTGARRDADLVVDVLDMVRGRARGDGESRRNVLMRVALRNETQHLDLAVAQAGRPGASPRRRS